MTLLSVNLNKIAVLRNSRGGDQPDMLRAAQTCIDAGCGGITVHPRPDQRHVRPDDVRAIAELLRSRAEYRHVEFNIEGNPFAPPRGSYPRYQCLSRARSADCRNGSAQADDPARRWCAAVDRW